MPLLRSIALLSVLLLGSCQAIPRTIEMEPQPKREGESVAPQPLFAATAILRAPPGGIGNGFGEVRVFADGAFSVHIRANLVPAERGEYQALLLPPASGTPLPLGKLQNRDEGTVHLLEMEGGTLNVVSEKTVWTLQIVWEPQEPSAGEERTVLEGTLKLPPLLKKQS